jgi:hypothetical protein
LPLFRAAAVGGTAPLYRRLLGKRFDALPRRVRELHDLNAVSVWSGRATVQLGPHPLARLIAWISGLPPSGRDVALRVTFTPREGHEHWVRDFGGHTFRSTQSADRDLLRERVGPTTFLFALDASPDGLALRLSGLRLVGVPLPRALHPKVHTIESDAGGRYCFEVESSLPRIGLLVRYAGWLERTADGCSA